MTLPNCWEIKNCGRQKGGDKVMELGECRVSVEDAGHSCWAIAGTLCGGTVQGSVAQKLRNCMLCEVYDLYNRSFGQDRNRVVAEYPDEQQRYEELLKSDHH